MTDMRIQAVFWGLIVWLLDIFFKAGVESSPTYQLALQVLPL